MEVYELEAQNELAAKSRWESTHERFAACKGREVPEASITDEMREDITFGYWWRKKK